MASLVRDLDRAVTALQRIDHGAGFTEDRNFPWTVAMEDAAGAGELRQLLQTNTELRDLLPNLTQALENGNATLGRSAALLEEAQAARRALGNGADP